MKANRRGGLSRTAGLLLVLSAIAAYALAVVSRPEDVIRVAPHHPVVIVAPQTTMTFPGMHLMADAGTFRDELSAYAAVREMRRRGTPAMPLAIVHHDKAVAVRLELPNDLLQAIPLVNHLRTSGLIGEQDWAVAPTADVNGWRDVSTLFDQLYSEVPLRSTRRAESAHVVADMLEIARFFGLSVRYFQPVPHAHSPPASNWTRQPAAGDVVLLRIPGATLVADKAAVEWQEISEALAHAQAVLDSGSWDYSKLSSHLRPNGAPADTRPEVLLTYAGALMRHLVDTAGVTAPETIAAWADRPDNPNVRHDPGVRRAALYARRVLAYAVHINRTNLLARLGFRPPGR